MCATLRLTMGLILLSALSITACHDTPPTVTTGDAGAAGPMNEKERLRAEQWAKAMQGLSFETASGRVEVQPIVGGSTAEAARHLARGAELLGANRIFAALEQYGLALRHDPDLARAYVGIGMVLKREGKLEQAEPRARAVRFRRRQGVAAASPKQDAEPGEGARVVAAQMLEAGIPVERVVQHLHDVYELPDAERVVAEVAAGMS